MTADISISLNVVRLAVAFCEVKSRSAMRWRMALIGVRMSRDPAASRRSAAGLEAAPSRAVAGSGGARRAARRAVGDNAASGGVGSGLGFGAGAGFGSTRSGVATGAAALGCGAALSSILPMTPPTSTLSPTWAVMCKMPLAGAGMPCVAFSDSISRIVSSSVTGSPSFLSHCATVPSVIDSPKLGTTMLTDMLARFLFVMPSPFHRERGPGWQ